MRFFTPARLVALCLLALLSVAASGVAHACPNNDTQASEDGGE